MAGFLLFMLAQTNAQSFYKGIIKGSLVNERKAPLMDATVILKNAKDSSIYRTALSTDGGIFLFHSLPEGNYFIEITSVGFEKMTTPGIQVNEAKAETDLGALEVKNASKMLGGITVKGQAPMIERQIDKTVVNIENSITGEGSSALEVMQKLPGVQVTQGGDITLNGKTGVTLFIDGKATYLSSADLANLLRGMASSSIQKIEIMTKPSAKFDAAGSGGVINIIKKRNRKEGLNGTVNGGLGWGRYGRYNCGFTTSYKNKGYNLFVNMAYLYNKTLLKTKITSDVFNESHLLTEQLSENSNIRASNSYTPLLGMEFYLSKRTTLSLSGTSSIQVANNKTSSLLDELDSNKLKTGSLTFVNKVRDKPFNYIASLHLTHQLDTTGKEISLDLDYSKNWNRTNQDISNIFHDAGGSFMDDSNTILNQHRNLYICAAKADYSQPIRGNGRLEAGWKSSYVKADNDDKLYNVIGNAKQFDSSGSNHTINEENINAFYLNINKAYKKLTLQGGLRAEHTWTKGEQLQNGQLIKRNYVQLFPSLFLDYKINKNNGLNLKVARRTDRAVYSQMNPFRRPLSPTLFFQGNPNLKPQLSINTEIVYSWKNALFLTFGYDFFQDYIGTIPYLDTNNVTVTRVPTNIKGARSFNFDIGYSKKVNAWWSTNNNVTIYKQSFQGKTNEFSLDNKGILSYDFNQNNSFILNDKLSAETNFRIISKHRVIGTTYGGYYILNLGLKQKVLKNQGSLSLNVTNILQSEDESSTYEYRNIYQNWRANFYTRAVSLNFTYRFGKGKTSQLRAGQGSEEEQKRTR